MDAEYRDIDEHIREAHRLRDQAVSEFFAAIGPYLSRLARRVSHAITAQLRSRHLLPH